MVTLITEENLDEILDTIKDDICYYETVKEVIESISSVEAKIGNDFPLIYIIGDDADKEEILNETKISNWQSPEFIVTHINKYAPLGNRFKIYEYLINNEDVVYFISCNNPLMNDLTC